MCLSYVKLNDINKPFKLPIPRCDDDKGTVGPGSNRIWIIRLDARKVFHQISVRHVGTGKLSFFAPDNQK